MFSDMFSKLEGTTIEVTDSTPLAARRTVKSVAGTDANGFYFVAFEGDRARAIDGKGPFASEAEAEAAGEVWLAAVTAAADEAGFFNFTERPEKRPNAVTHL